MSTSGNYINSNQRQQDNTGQSAFGVVADTEFAKSQQAQQFKVALQQKLQEQAALFAQQVDQTHRTLSLFNAAQNTQDANNPDNSDIGRAIRNVQNPTYADTTVINNKAADLTQTASQKIGMNTPAMSLMNGGVGNTQGTPVVPPTQQPAPTMQGLFQSAQQNVPTPQITPQTPNVQPNQPMQQPQLQVPQVQRQGTVIPQSQGTPNQGTVIPQAKSQMPDLSQKPDLNQVYGKYSTAPFGSKASDIYEQNPNPIEAMKSGEWLKKKDPAILQTMNPLSLPEKDVHVLSDATQLIKKYGYSKEEVFNQLSDGTKSLIDTVGQYRATPAELTSSLGGGRQKQELVKAVQSFYPGWSDAVYDQRHRSLIDFTDPNGANGQAIASLRQGVLHLNDLGDAIQAVSNKTLPLGLGRSVPVLNAPADKIRQYVGGDPDILALKQNLNAVSEEMTKAWGGARAGEARLKNWQDTLSSANSPQGWQGLLKKTATLWQDAAKSRESMFELAMGGQKMQDVLGSGVLPDEQQQILEKFRTTGTGTRQVTPPTAEQIQTARQQGYTHYNSDTGEFLK